MALLDFYIMYLQSLAYIDISNRLFSNSKALSAAARPKLTQLIF